MEELRLPAQLNGFALSDGPTIPNTLRLLFCSRVSPSLEQKRIDGRASTQKKKKSGMDWSA